MRNYKIKTEFAGLLESLFEKGDEDALRNSLIKRVRNDSLERRDYVCQMRLHLMLTDYFSLEKAVCRWNIKWVRIAALIVLVLGVSAVLFVPHERTGNCLNVVASEVPMLTADEYDMLKAFYFAEHTGVMPFQGLYVKYEPGTIENPGAAIEVLQMSTRKTSDHNLNEGDRVWRQKISQTEGQMKFKLGEHGVVTVVGLAEVRLHDDKTIEVTSGCVYVEAHHAVSLVLAGRRFVLDKTSVGVVARNNGSECDLVVTEGLVLLGEGRCLRVQDGMRMMSDGAWQAFRSFADAQILRGKFIAGVADVKIGKIGKESKNVL